MIIGGKSYVSAPPAFSNDGTRLLVCTGTVVSIFSAATALQVSSLEGHTAAVTAVIVVPPPERGLSGGRSLCFCWTASLDGTIRYWDFAAQELMKTVCVQMPIHSMVIPSMLDWPAKSGNNNEPSVFAYISVENPNQPINHPKGAENQKAKGKSVKTLKGEIRKCNLTKSQLVAWNVLGQTKQPECISISPCGKFFGIRDNRKLRIWNVPATDTERSVVKRINLHHTKYLTVLAFHPTERLVAAGDLTGRILMWRNFGYRTFGTRAKEANGSLIKNDEDRPGVRGDDEADSCSTWHWHPTEVNVLSFSSDGAYLFSGGREGVLVVWQINTGKKKFLPRIGSPLLYFTASLDPSLSSISCADNRIHLLKMPSMEILKSISGIKLPLSIPKKIEGICNKFAFDYSAGLVALSTENYCIQIYSLFDDREVSEVHVCERNHQPSDEVTVIVTSVTLSLDGSTMCTTEVKLPEEGIGALVCLKFWTLDSLNKNFGLSTIIYEPHRDAFVSAVAFHPSRQMAVSSSYGGDFKLWVSKGEIMQNHEMVKHSGWTCHSIGSYKNKPMTAAAFSADGSVLAVAAETAITLWDPENNVLVAVLGENQSPITSLSFAGKSDCLVSVSRGLNPQLSAWNMSKLTVSWSYKLQVEDIACSLNSSIFAVLVILPKLSRTKGSISNAQTLEERGGVILLFNVDNPIPMATWSVREAMGGKLAFIRGNQLVAEPSQESLVYVDGNHEYVVFDPHADKALELSLARTEAIALEETGQFGYASIYGELPNLEPKRNQNLLETPSAPSKRPWETIFSGSSHAAPPLNKLCSAFLESLLEKRSTVVE